MSFRVPPGVFNTGSAYFYPLSAAGALGTLIKQPSEQTLVFFDYGGVVPAVVLSSATFAVDVSSNPELVVSFPTIISNRLSFMLSGGIAGVQYSLVVTATLADTTTRADGLFINIPSQAGDCVPRFDSLPDIYSQTPVGTNSYVNSGVRFFWGEAPPSNPNVGDQWYLPSAQALSEWITDGVNFLWKGISAGSSVPEAPSNGIIYGRANAGWVANPIQSDAPNDGKFYSRSNGAWGLPSTTGTETNVTTNRSVTTAGTYYIKTAGLTITLPTVAFAGDITLVDMVGAWPNLTLAGTAVNNATLTDILPRNGRLTLRWSTLNAGVLVI